MLQLVSVERDIVKRKETVRVLIRLSSQRD